jgi:HAD superfamily hydrolase (TIGR01509 family)
MIPSDLTTAVARARGILFDMDGVLIDSEPTHEKSIVALTAELGAAIDDQKILDSFKGTPEQAMAVRLIEMYPNQTWSAEQIVERNIQIFASLFPEVGLVPGAKEFLVASHAAGRNHGLATSASRSTQQLAFETFGFAPYFEAIVTGDDIHRGKPDPEPYLLAAAKLGLPAADCLVIEDSINGVRSGKAAGCIVIGITTTFSRQLLIQAGADFVVDSFSEFEL